ncbi:MAG: hypothetical protein KDA41_05670 [Planctomycetales bacterium]|nr:hypothetical protein [Planctomycetales bacterium]
MSLQAWLGRSGIIRALQTLAGPDGTPVDLNPTNHHNVSGTLPATFSVPVKLRVGTGGGNVVGKPWADPDGSARPIYAVQDGEHLPGLWSSLESVTGGVVASEITYHHSLPTDPATYA